MVTDLLEAQASAASLVLRSRSCLLGQVDVLHQLLGDGRPALGDPAGLDVLEQGPAECPDVHAPVVVELGVLDREDRLLDLVGDLGEGHRLAVLRAVQHGHGTCRRRRTPPTARRTRRSCRGRARRADRRPPGRSSPARAPPPRWPWRAGPRPPGWWPRRRRASSPGPQYRRHPDAPCQATRSVPPRPVVTPRGLPG